MKSILDVMLGGGGSSGPPYEISIVEDTVSSATITIPVPPGTQLNDHLVALVCTTGTSSDRWTGPTGWTEICDSGQNENLAVYYKLYTGGSSFTFTHGKTGKLLSGCIMKFSSSEIVQVNGSGVTTSNKIGQTTISRSYSNNVSSFVLALYATNTEAAGLTYSLTPGTFSLIGESTRLAPTFKIWNSQPNSYTATTVTITTGASSSQSRALCLVGIVSNKTVILSDYAYTNGLVGLSTTETTTTTTVSSNAAWTTATATPTLATTQIRRNAGAWSTAGSSVTVYPGDVLDFRVNTPTLWNTSISESITITPNTGAGFAATYSISITSGTYFEATAGVTSLTLPTGVTNNSVSILCLGGGGGGGTAANGNLSGTTMLTAGGGGGGGGGHRFTNSISGLTAGTTLTVTRGQGGASSSSFGVNGAAGTGSSVTSGGSTIVAINGGGGGGSSSGTGGTAGSTTGTGASSRTGRAGNSQSGGQGGGGGGSGSLTGTLNNGANANITITIDPTYGTTNATGPGAQGGQGVSYTSTGWSTVIPSSTSSWGDGGATYGGGGGGGSAYDGSEKWGGDGGSGAVIIIWNGRTFSTTGSTY